MRRLLTFLLTRFLTGLVVILPAWLTLVLLGGIFNAIRTALHPFGDWLAKYAAHPDIVALVLLCLLCLFCGALLGTRAGGAISSKISSGLGDSIPGFRLVSSLVRRLTGSERDQSWAVALIEFDDGLMPGFVVEALPDGLYTVYIPSVPTPAAGAVYVMEARRVHIVDVPFTQGLKCVTHWGAGTSALVAARHREG